METEVCCVPPPLKYDCHEQAMIPLQTQLRGSNVLANIFFPLSIFSSFLLHPISFVLWLLAITYEDSVVQASPALPHLPPPAPGEDARDKESGCRPNKLTYVKLPLPCFCPTLPDNIHPYPPDSKLLSRLGEMEKAQN